MISNQIQIRHLLSFSCMPGIFLFTEFLLYARHIFVYWVSPICQAYFWPLCSVVNDTNYPVTCPGGFSTIGQCSFLNSLPIFPCSNPTPILAGSDISSSESLVFVKWHSPTLPVISQVLTCTYQSYPLYSHFSGTVHLFWAMASLHSTLHTVGAQYILRGLCVLRNI